MRFLKLIRSVLAGRAVSPPLNGDQVLQDFARSLDRQSEGDLLDLLALLPRAECASRTPELHAKRALVLTRMHRLTMEADGQATAA